MDVHRIISPEFLDVRYLMVALARWHFNRRPLSAMLEALVSAMNKLLGQNAAYYSKTFLQSTECGLCRLEQSACSDFSGRT
jgi:hypothetical protein